MRRRSLFRHQWFRQHYCLMQGHVNLVGWRWVIDNRGISIRVPQKCAWCGMEF